MRRCGKNRFLSLNALMASQRDDDYFRNTSKGRSKASKGKAPRRNPGTKRNAMLWTLNSIENSDTDTVQLSTLTILREIVFAKNTRQLIDAGKKLNELDLTSVRVNEH